MKIKRSFVMTVVCLMILGLSGCTNRGEKVSENQLQNEKSSIESEGEEQNNTDVQMQNETEVQTPSFENDDNIIVGKQADAELEEELKRYRQEREDNIKEVNGLVEGGSPNEDNYSFDLSGAFYSGQFDTRETTEGYAAARIYVTDTLGIKPNTKMPVYMCIDPRILVIYEDEDKGVATGYDISNIFVCEYCNEEDIWQYLILVRDGKGSEWKVIHNGNSYKE